MRRATVERLDLLADTEGKQWHVHRVFKNTIVLRGSGASEGMERRIKQSDLASYIKAEIPTKVNKGQILFCGGFQCVVNGFMAPAFVLLWGKWGSKDGAEHENAVPMSKEYFAAYGVRLPFPGEVMTGANS